MIKYGESELRREPGLRWQEPKRIPAGDSTPVNKKDVILTVLFITGIFAFVLAVALPSVL